MRDERQEIFDRNQEKLINYEQMMKANQVLVEVSDEERKAQEERIARKKEQERQEQIRIKLAQVSAGNLHNERNQP